MKTLYIECKMGVAGDMLMSALYELLTPEQQDQFIYTMNNLIKDHLRVEIKKEIKCGISGTQIQVIALDSIEDSSNDFRDKHHGGHHPHYSYNSLLDLIQQLDIPFQIKGKAKDIYRIIGEAESKVHNQPLEQIHFHEVGSLDALADVVGVCLLLNMLNPELILASPINVGNGTVHCAHGILPVPAPATAQLLKAIPYYTSNIQGELCTPTGAALLKYFVAEYCEMPAMITESVGIGAGHKDFDEANIVRAFIGETQNHVSDSIIEISTNIDDMTGEEMGYALDILIEHGALDVFYTSIFMKKNRPGYMLTVICNPKDQDRITKLIFEHTTTRGVRFTYKHRNILDYSIQTFNTSLGPVRVKTSSGYGISKSKYEYEDLVQIARSHNMSIMEIKEILNNEISLLS